MVKFHILDVFTQDFKNEYEDEFEKKGTYEFVKHDDEDDIGYDRKIKINNSKYEMVIHLFGLTEDGKTIITQDLKDIYPGDEEIVKIKNIIKIL